MRIDNLIVLTMALLFVSDQSFASQITVDYTGTYTGSWFGNYSPIDYSVPAEGLSYGQFASAPFRLTFSFDTSLAAPGPNIFFNPSTLTNIPPMGAPLLPSVGSAVFIGSTNPFGGCCNFSAGDLSAYDRASKGSTTQYADSLELTRDPYVTYLSPVIQIGAGSPNIPSSILTPFKITDGL